MNNNEYGEIINGDRTYQEIAKRLLNSETVGIGWTDNKSLWSDETIKIHT